MLACLAWLVLLLLLARLLVLARPVLAVGLLLALVPQAQERLAALLLVAARSTESRPAAVRPGLARALVAARPDRASAMAA